MASNAIGDQLGFIHEAGTKRPPLNPLTRAAAIQIDLAVAEALTDLCSPGQVVGFTAAQLQCQRMLCLAETEQALQIAMEHRTGGHHLGVQAALLADISRWK